MKPRVFVSSTYYDLKYLRERIELFLDRFNFEPVLFESDKVTYEHGKPIDNAAYNEVTLCHMMILIVGGRYGTPSSTIDNIKEWQKKYDDEFVSITRKEYDTALKSNIPIFIFIDKNVYAEYQSFKDNEKFFRQLIDEGKIDNGTYKFSHVDNHNVFYFIDQLRQKAIKNFENVEEIENYLENQFSGMFFLYLKQLQETNSNQKVIDTITELNTVVNKMNEMVTGIGKIVIKDPHEFEEINKKQFEIISENFASRYFLGEDELAFENAVGSNESQSRKVADIFYEKILSINIPEEILYKKRVKQSKEERLKLEVERDSFVENLINEVNTELNKINPDIRIVKLDFFGIHRSFNKTIKPFLNTTPDNIGILKNAMSEWLDINLM